MKPIEITILFLVSGLARGAEPAPANGPCPKFLQRISSPAGRSLDDRDGWDLSLPLVAATDVVAFDPKEFAPTRFYLDDQAYVSIAKLGTGSEHAVFRVQNEDTGEFMVLKIGVPYAGGLAVSESQRIIKRSGLPVIDLEAVGPHANFVEEIPIFGTDVIRAAILRARSAKSRP